MAHSGADRAREPAQGAASVVAVEGQQRERDRGVSEPTGRGVGQRVPEFEYGAELALPKSESQAAWRMSGWMRVK